MIRALAVAASIVAAPALVLGTSVLPVTFDQLVAQADVIFQAVVVNVESRTVDAAGRELIVTDVTFQPLRVLKGSASTYVVMRFMGGVVGDRSLTVHEMPRFAIGDRDILFARPNRREASPIVGFMQGRFRVATDAATGREIVRRFDREPLTSTAQLGLPTQPLLLRAAPLSVADFEDAVTKEVARQAAAAR